MAIDKKMYNSVFTEDGQLLSYFIRSVLKESDKYSDQIDFVIKLQGGHAISFSSVKPVIKKWYQFWK